MNIERSEVVWIESRSDYSVDEVAALSGLPTDVVGDLVDCGALPARDPRVQVRFEAETVVLARAARRLREHFELDAHGLAVAVSLLRRVRTLEMELSAARARGSPTID